MNTNNKTPKHEFVELNSKDLLTIEGGNGIIKYLHEIIERFDFADKRSENDNSIKRG